MRRNIHIAALVLVLCVILSGCSLWMDGEYLSVVPHQEQNLGSSNTVVDITAYSQLPDVLTDMVESGMASGAVTAPELNQKDLRDYLDDVVKDVAENTAIGAYAVENITYDIGTNRGKFAIAFHISYYLNRSDVLRIKHVQTTQEATALVGTALDECVDSLVVLVDDYTDADYSQIVRTYANDNPHTVMEIPQVTTRIYPEQGEKRVVELRFTYQTDREKLLEMQKQVELIFTSAELYVKEIDQIQDVYSRLYSFLMERHDYTFESSTTPSFSLLYRGVGDSRAFANVYAAMCRRVGLDCRVISGTKNGTPWSWNYVRYRGNYYHVDLLQCHWQGEFAMLRNAEMQGYVWEETSFN